MDHNTNHLAPLPQPNSLESDVIEVPWSEHALIWIQLYHDLLFAAACTPAGPTVIVVDTVAFRAFIDSIENEPIAVFDLARDKKEFVEKKNHLVAAKRSAIKALSISNAAQADPPLITHVKITQDMLETYDKLRVDCSPEEDILHPDRSTKLWQFLSNAIREEYPKLYSKPSKPRPSLIGTKAIAHPGGGRVHLKRLSYAGMDEPSSHEAPEAKVPEELSTPEVVTAAKRTREDSPETVPDPSVNREEPPRKRAKLIDATHGSEATPEATSEAGPEAVSKTTPKKRNYRWTENEVNCIYRCINEYCKAKGVDVYTRKHVVPACFDALLIECANEHPLDKDGNPKTRGRQEVDSKIMNLERCGKEPAGVSSIRTLVAKAAAVKKQIADGEDVSNEDRYPSEFLSPINLQKK
jgi:hypothetical protein